MAKILSIEVGNSITRVAEMDYKVKNPKVYKYFSISTPRGVVEDGFIQENVEFSLTLRRALSDYKIKTKSVIFTVTSSKIITREVTIPEIKMNQVGGYVRANANDYFPIDLSIYEIAHIVLGVERGEGGPGKLRVLVMAAGKDLINGYAQFATNCGLKLTCVDYSGNSIYQLMKNECGDEAALVVKMEDNQTIASVMANRAMVLQRSLAYGFDRAVNAVMESPEFYETNYGEAFKTMCQKPCIKVVTSERTKIREADIVAQESELGAEARTKITASFAQLLGNLSRVIELYNSKEPLNPIRSVLLVGAGSEIANMTRLMTNELGVPVKTCNHLGTVSIFQPMDGINYGRFVSVFGAVIDPVSMTPSEIKVRSKTKLNYTPLTTVVGVVAAAAVGWMFLTSNNALQTEKRREEDLKALEQEYQEAEKVYRRYLAVKKFQTHVDNRYRMTEHPNDNMYKMLGEMETKLLADIWLTELSSDSEKMILTINAATVEEIGQIFKILRGMDSVMDCRLENAQQEIETDEEGEQIGTHFKFEAHCYFYPNEVEELVETEEEEEFAESEEEAENQ